MTSFRRPPPLTKHCVLTFPTPEIILVKLDRPQVFNCINRDGHDELHKVWMWLDAEPGLRVGIVTGDRRAFCAGADLKEWNAANSATSREPPTRHRLPDSGFGGLSRRGGKKPVIAAVDGVCFGGGLEMVINCDIVVASDDATFALPEVRRGVVANSGALPRLIRTVGRQRAMEIALTGREFSAREANEWGIVNQVARDGKSAADVALEYAETIARNSPDAVIIAREGLKLGLEGVGVEEGSRILLEQFYPQLLAGENFAEGIRSFVEKRRPRWVDSKL